MRHRSSVNMSGWMLGVWVTMTASACGTAPVKSKLETSRVQAVAAPAALVSLLTVEIQDGLAAALPEGPCVTRVATDPALPDALADAAAGIETRADETWSYNACRSGNSGISLSGERRLWNPDAAGTPTRSRFILNRQRGDGAAWKAEGQTEYSGRIQRGSVSEHRALMHGTMTPSGERNHMGVRHVYAYHLRITEGLDGPSGRRLSGVAQLNFATLEATSQVKLVSLILSPACAWPVAGHVSIATTASDGSFLDTSLMFTDMCGVIKDDQGNLTPLLLPWDEEP